MQGFFRQFFELWLASGKTLLPNLLIAHFLEDEGGYSILLFLWKLGGFLKSFGKKFRHKNNSKNGKQRDYNIFLARYQICKGHFFCENAAMEKLPLSTPLSQVLRTTAKYLALLKEIGVRTLGDLLSYFPREYEDHTQIREMADLRADEKNVLKGTFSLVRRERTRNRMTLVKALFTDEHGNSLECVWFNQPYLHTMLPVGKPVMVVGKAKLGFGKISLQNPTFEEITAEDTVHGGRIVPVYREHDALTSIWLRQKIYPLLEISEEFPTILPEEVMVAEKLLPKHAAVLEMHFPTSREKLEQAKETLSFEELFLLQLASLERKRQWREETAGKGKPIPLDAELQKAFFATLPFTPTNSQKIAIFEILKDLEKDTPMLRLLEGDVGSGKTLVALSAALAVIAAGYQVALLAPTEILAQQHAASIPKFLEQFSLLRSGAKSAKKEAVRSALLTGAVKGKKRAEILEQTRFGNIDLLIGTHALLEDPVVFQDLGLAIIDEQHRFGVRQRERLVDSGSPHLLQMTATPIPRTLAIVAFGDQDLSVLTELPPGRKEIYTKVVAPPGRHQVELFIAGEVEKGHQAFVICPLVSESEKIDAKAAEKEFIRLQKDIFPHLRLALIHGRMKSQEKDQIMVAFKNREYDILVSTSVIEVGIDIPNANIIVIEGAERFGLSQLHQFRGRVGRGEVQSYCFLFPTEQPTERLRAMEKVKDGFKLAEIDLKLRGPGAIFGTRQSGIPDLKMASFSDARIVVRARQAAERFLEEKRGFGAYPLLEREVRKMNETVVGGG